MPQIVNAIETLGYYEPKIEILPLWGKHYMVYLNGNEFGIWDDNKKTFVN